MSKNLEEMSFLDLSKQFPIEYGLEKRTNGSETILIPYKEIRVANYEMPKFDFSTRTPDAIVKPHRVELRIRVYEGDVE